MCFLKLSSDNGSLQDLLQLKLDCRYNCEWALYMKTGKQKSRALGVKHVQGDVYLESLDSSGLKKRQWWEGKVKVCTQHANKLVVQIICSHAVESWVSGLSVMQQVAFQMQQMQRRSGNISKCCLAPHQQTLKNQTYSTGILYRLLLHSSHACVAQHMPFPAISTHMHTQFCYHKQHSGKNGIQILRSHEQKIQSLFH